MSNLHFERVRELISKIKAETPSSAEELEQFRLRYLGTKNQIKPLFAAMREVAADDRKNFGLLLNQAKKVAEQKFSTIQQELSKAKSSKGSSIDLTAPGLPLPLGIPSSRFCSD